MLPLPTLDDIKVNNGGLVGQAANRVIDKEIFCVGSSTRSASRTTVSRPQSRAHSHVTIDCNTFELADSDHPQPMGFPPRNGLIFSAPGIAAIAVGASSGVVNVSVEVLDRPPSQLETDGWDEVVDHGMESPTGQLRVRALMADAPDLPLLTPAGPGSYRVRIHARGRDAAPDAVASQPYEDYLITVWPAPPQADIIHKQTDRVGASWREQAEHTPVPPPEPAQDAQREAVRDHLGRLHG